MKPSFTRLAVAALMSGSLTVHAELANAIKAIVNDAVITYQEVATLSQPAEDQAFRQYRYQPSILEKKLLDIENENLGDLVDRQLILHEFKTAGYNLPESVVDDLVQETIKNDFGDRATLTKTLDARGITYEKFRQQVRERFIIGQLRLKYISSEIIISPHKVESYYLAHREDFKEEDQVKLRKLVLTKSSDPNAPNARKLAEEILTRLNEGASFEAMLSEVRETVKANYSQGSQDSPDGVWYNRSALRRELADAAFALKPGQWSGVVETSGECYLLIVDEVNASHYKTLGEVRSTIEKTLLTDERARIEKQWIDRLKKKTFVQYFP
jgi:peptidyl-prolyl cis-trans isomerase SurA